MALRAGERWRQENRLFANTYIRLAFDKRFKERGFRINWQIGCEKPLPTQYDLLGFSMYFLPNFPQRTSTRYSARYYDAVEREIDAIVDGVAANSPKNATLYCRLCTDRPPRGQEIPEIQHVLLFYVE